MLPRMIRVRRKKEATRINKADEITKTDHKILAITKTQTQIGTKFLATLANLIDANFLVDDEV